MANIRTCLKPDVSYLSASGNPCIFNTGLGGHGKDLQKCVVEFSSQSAISSLDLVVNGTTNTISFGESLTDGSVDVLNGILTRSDDTTASITPIALTQIASQNTITGGSEVTDIEVDYLRIGPTSSSGMAESFKIPTVTYPEVTGNPITFDSEFALPLKKCEVAFSASQASGTPTPQNPIPIVGVSSLDVVVNGSTISETLGDTYYGGKLNILTGVLTLDHYLMVGTFSAYTTSGVFQLSGFSQLLVGYNGINKCSCYVKSTVNNVNNMDDKSFVIRPTVIYLKDSDYANDLSGFNSLMAQNQLVCELATPIEVQLTPEQVSTIVGTNTITTSGDSVSAKYIKVEP